MRKYCKQLSEGTNAQIMAYIALTRSPLFTVRTASDMCKALWYLTDKDNVEAGEVSASIRCEYRLNV
jgi:hypothetical protein